MKDRLHLRRARLPLVAVVMAFVAGALVTLAPVPVAVEAAPTVNSSARPMTQRFTANVAGNIAVIGNAQQTCPVTASGCSQARAGTGTKLNNNDFGMVWIDVDDNGGTTNSTTATLDIPASARVLFARLYWGGLRPPPTPLPTGGSLVKVKFSTPTTSAYVELEAGQLDLAAPDAADYGASVDVTALVAAAGPGVYHVADIVSRTGLNGYAGWSLVVAYADPNEPVRNLTVYDGYVNVAPGNNASIPVSGFRTPSTGTVRTTMGFIAFEGDRGASGDQLKLNGVSLPKTDSSASLTRPATNFFDSSITTTTGNVTAREPAYVNNFSMDTGLVDASGILANNATSAVLSATTVGDYYKAAALTFATELTAPRFTASLSASPDHGEQNDIVEFSALITNTGADASSATTVSVTVPPGLAYVPNSSTVSGIAASDTGGVVSVAGTPGSGETLTYWIGSGAASGTGGTLAVGASVPITFRASVSASSAALLKVSSSVTGTASVSGLTISGQSNEVDISVISTEADLSITIRAVDQDPANPNTTAFVAGERGRLLLEVFNNGPRDVTQVTSTTTLSAGMTYVSGSGDGWTCSHASPVVTCTRGALSAGDAAPPLELRVDVPSSAAASTVTTSTSITQATSGITDTNPSNNADTATIDIVRHADLGVAVERSGSSASGGTLLYAFEVGNGGPSDAANVTLSATLPANLTFVAASTGSGWACTAVAQVITCTRPSLVAGPPVPVATVSATVNAAGHVDVSATVTSDEADPEPADNTAVDTTESLVEAALVESVVNTTAATTTSANSSTVSVTVGVKNAGPSAVPSGTTILHTIEIPTGASLSAIAQANGWSCTPLSGAGPTVSVCTLPLAGDWTVGTALPDVVLDLMRTDATADELVVRATVSTDAPEVVLDPDLATADDDIADARAADLLISGPTSASVPAGGSTVVDLEVDNLGASADPGPLHIAISAPNGVGLAGGSSDDWSCAVTEDGDLDCVHEPRDPLAVGDPVPPLPVRVSAADPAGLLVAVVGSPISDPHPENDSLRIALLRAPAPPSSGVSPVVRIGGTDRIDTAVEMAQEFFPTPPAGQRTPVVYLATARDFADALVAGPPAGLARGPVLLTETDRLPAATAAEITRLRPADVVIVGGPAAVGTPVEDALRSAGWTVRRVGGVDRYETAVLLGRAWKPGTGGTVYVATGTDFADALSAGPAAGAANAPVLLVRPSAVPTSTELELLRRQPERVVIVGGTTAIDAGVESALRRLLPLASVDRVAGADRYGTSALVSAGRFGNQPPVSLLAVGTAFPDALTAAPVATMSGGPVLLVSGTCVPAAIAAELTRLGPARIVLVGGVMAAAESVASLTRCP